MDPVSDTKLSDPTARLDTDAALDDLVEKGSIPTLASLFQAGKDAGLIKPSVAYGDGATASP